ncbi:hypothetical protein GCM10010387_10960 [Streptomyces inusitatus]|uniref:Uncharacterized protein n=1 Tax=Streptomyces inusitatus TaxID=68221 RepID=A0A918PQV2_9ACTN|nr:hypothetical protein [Streptomyces inusitatus]GGZ19836.1 hypothetical protein GCM10010387_10960 [Streptomyces inusitatus]
MTGRLDDSSATLEVTGLEIAERGRSFDLVVELLAHGERWRVRLPRDNSDSALFDGSPPPHLVRHIASLTRAQLFDWWHTKGHERQSAKLGERLT